MRQGLIAPVLAIALLSAACSTSTQTGALLTGPIWCKASQLEARLVFMGFATGNVEAIIDVRNNGDRDCDLSGYPGLQLLDGSGGPLPTDARDTTTTFFQTTPAVEVVVTLAAGSDPITTEGVTPGHAYIVLSWSDGSPPCEQPASFAITPWDSGGSIVVNATPPVPETPMPYICDGGAVAVLPLQPDKLISFHQATHPSPTPSPLVIPSPNEPFVFCLASDLSMSFFVLGAAGGSVRAMIEVRNTSSRECDLDGYAGLQFLDSKRRPLPTHVVWTPTNFWSSGPEPENVVALPAGTPRITGDEVAGHAYIPLWWSDVMPPYTNPSVIGVTPPGSYQMVDTQEMNGISDIGGNGTVYVNPIQPASRS